MSVNFKNLFKTVVPKRAQYEKDLSELKSQIASNSLKAVVLKKRDPAACNETVREIALLNLRHDSLAEEYNRFVARENACQKAFEHLNGLK